MKDKISIFWFRRDLRLEDNVGLFQALASDYPVLPIFIFDITLLETLEDKTDRRVDYIHQALSEINRKLKAYHSKLTTFYGNLWKFSKNFLKVMLFRLFSAIEITNHK